jgi:hypothetical protein
MPMTTQDGIGFVCLVLPGVLIGFALWRLWNQAKAQHRANPRNPQTAYRNLLGTNAYAHLWSAAAFAAAVSIGYVFWWKIQQSPEAANTITCNNCNLAVNSSLAPDDAAEWNKVWPALHVILWIILPPAFFIFEWTQVYRGPAKGATYARYKIGQQLATKVWAAIVVALGAIYKFG